MFVTTRLAVAALAAAFAGLLPGSDVVGMLIADGALLLTLAYDVIAAPRPGSLRLTREAPAVCGVGRLGTVRLRIHNPTSRHLVVSVNDASPPTLNRQPRRHSETVARGGWATLSASIVPARRGWVSLGPVTVRTLGPLGLGGRQGTIALPTRLKVYPPLPSRAEVALRLDRARLLQSGERSAAVRGGGTEFDSLREYHVDDEFRRINWRATARASKPISNVFREERNQQVILMLDAGRMMAGTQDGVPRFEHAIDAAVAVAELAARVGDHVGMVAFGRDVVAAITPSGGRAQPRRVLDALFALVPTLDAPNYRDAFSSTLARHRRRAFLVVFTELAGEAPLDPLFAAIPALLSRHLVIVASVSDPGVLAAAEAPALNEELVYQKAAAAGAVAARERAGARLRRLGAVVVDEPPGRLAGRVADEYLRIKAFGRL
jgi:uncharacterized protein (DUF58 family)